MATGEVLDHHRAAGARRGRRPAVPVRCGLIRYLVAALLVRLADEGSRVALVLLAVDRGLGPGFGAAMVAALLVPHVIAAPVVGLLTDRVRQPRWVLAAGAAGFATALAAAAGGAGHVPAPGILAVLAAGGCCGPALTGALSSQLPSLVTPEGLPRAFGLDSLTYNVAGITGPLLATLTATTMNATAATDVLAVSATLGGGALTTLATPLRTTPRRAARPPMLAGVRALVRQPTLRVITAASSLGQLGPGALPVVAVVLTARAHHPADAGWLLSALAAGGLLGSLLWTWRPAPATRAHRTVLVALAGIGAPLAAGALVPDSVSVLAVLFTASGVALGPFTSALFLVRDHHAPDGLRAQVFAVGAGLKTTATAAGAALAGALTDLPAANQLLLVGATPSSRQPSGALRCAPAQAPNEQARHANDSLPRRPTEPTPNSRTAPGHRPETRTASLPYSRSTDDRHGFRHTAIHASPVCAVKIVSVRRWRSGDSRWSDCPARG